jgi:regulator of protease activity HflC (stomatin/prohibitin superfamily)
MSRSNVGGDRKAEVSLRFKTIDGNDISVNVTVAWRLDPTMAWYIVQFVGRNNDAVKEKLVRPVSRTIIRDSLNSLASEQFYDAESRYRKAAEAKDRLSAVLGPEGVIVEQVLLGEHAFNSNYEQIIRDKKVAEQNAARLRSESEAAREQALRELEVKKGEVQQQIEQARGEAQRKHIEADARFYEKEKQAQAIVAEAMASSEGLKARAKALAGSGGSAQVKLKVAQALKGKPILFIPAVGGMDVRTTDMNALLSRYGIGAITGADAKTTAAGQ